MLGDAHKFSPIRFWSVVAGLVVVLATAVACTDATGPGLFARPITFMQLVDGVWQIDRVGLGGSAPQSFSLGQGNSTYPAVSFDGRLLAYVREGANGGVFVLPIDSGPAQRAYPDASVNGIAWSPDGKRVLLALSGGLRLLNLFDSSTQDIATDLSQPAWSPDGRTILAAAGGFGTRVPGIYSLSPDGSNVQLVIPGDSVGLHDPAWSPDGSRIAFAGGNGISFIYSARPDGSDVHQLTRAGPHQSVTDLKPAWSPDGSRIAFQREYFPCDHGTCHDRYDIFVMFADGIAPHNITGGTLWGGVFPTW